MFTDREYLEFMIRNAEDSWERAYYQRQLDDLLSGYWD